MRSVHDHLAAVLAAARPVTPLDVVLGDAAGCILAEDVTAPRDVPEALVAGCDGYAVRVEDVGDAGSWAAGSAEVSLPVVDDAAVGAQSGIRLVPGTTVLVAAGALVPYGADAVVPMERTDRGRARVVVRGGARLGEHLRPAGHDAGAGQVVLAAGRRLAARHLAVAAAVGRSRVRVHPAPRVVVVTIGDELVEPGRAWRPGAVYDADSHALAAAAKDAGATAVRVGPVGDDRATLREVIADQLVRADLLVLTGGLSAGPWDTVTDVLAPLGTVRFDQIAMTPGRRQGFGAVRRSEGLLDRLDAGSDHFGTGARGTRTAPGSPDDEAARAARDARDDLDAVPVFALPGHPVAAQISYEVFVRPALRAMGGYPDLFRTSVRAAVTRPWSSPAGRRQLVPATLAGSPADGYVATPVGDPVHATVSGLAQANALVVVPEGTTEVHAGDVLPCLVLEA